MSAIEKARNHGGTLQRLNGETVAKSAPIYPGQHIDGLTLSRQVSPGNYNVTAAIKYYNKTTKAYLGMADYKIRLSVS